MMAMRTKINETKRFSCKSVTLLTDSFDLSSVAGDWLLSNYHLILVFFLLFVTIVLLIKYIPKMLQISPIFFVQGLKTQWNDCGSTYNQLKNTRDIVWRLLISQHHDVIFLKYFFIPIILLRDVLDAIIHLSYNVHLKTTLTLMILWFKECFDKYIYQHYHPHLQFDLLWFSFLSAFTWSRNKFPSVKYRFSFVISLVVNTHRN